MYTHARMHTCSHSYTFMYIYTRAYAHRHVFMRAHGTCAEIFFGTSSL